MATLTANNFRRDIGKLNSNATVPRQVSPNDCQIPKPIAKIAVIAAILLAIREVTNGISSSDLSKWVRSGTVLC